MALIDDFIIESANVKHIHLASIICNEMADSARVRGTGIAKREPKYIENKIKEGKAVIAMHTDGSWAGFIYIEAWGHEKYVAHSGLIIAPEYRKLGLASAIKKAVFELSRQKYPEAKVFGLTTGLAVMKINAELGYRPVTYSMLTDDSEFWKGCESCINYSILESKERQNCLCTAMIFDPSFDAKDGQANKNKVDFDKKVTVFDRLIKIKRVSLLKPFGIFRSRK